jgi:hypothetical protein
MGNLAFEVENQEGIESIGIKFIDPEGRECVDYWSLDEAHELATEIYQILDKLGFDPLIDPYEEIDLNDIEDYMER